jgi:hypothetical protein
MPERPTFVSSWVSAISAAASGDGMRRRHLLQRWVAEWSHLVAFEIVPVVAQEGHRAALAGQL